MIKDTLPKLMSELKLNDNMLAKITGLSATAISVYRRGLASPTEYPIMQIAYMLGISTDELLGFDEFVEEMEEK